MPYTFTYSLPVILGTVSFVTLLSLPGLVHAETKTILSEATYSMGDGETPSFAEAMVLQKAKQRALEEAGTYVEAYTKVQNLDLTTEEIQTITGGVLLVEVMEHNRRVVGEGFQFFIKIKAVVTTDKMEELAQRIRGRNITGDYRKLQSDYARLEKEVSSLKELLAQPRMQENDRQVAQDRLRDQEKTLAGIQRQEGVLFERLLSGKDLHSRAEQQLTDKKLRAQNQKATAAVLYQDIAERGHQITIGEPEIETRLGEQGKAILIFPVSIKADPSVQAKVREASKAFGGDFAYGEYRKLEKRLEDLSFVMEIVGQTGRTYICNAPRHVSLYQGDGDFIGVGSGPDHYNVQMTVPLNVIKEMTSVRGKFVESASGDLCGLIRRK